MRPRIAWVCLLSLVAGLVFSPRVAEAQSLGDVAAKEQNRRRSIRTPARVITEADLSAALGTVSSSSSLPVPPAVDDDPRAGRVAVSPARLRTGNVPVVPIQAVSAGEVVLEVAVGRDGRVTGVRPLRETAPFTEALSAAVKAWTFAPAEDAPAPAPGVEPDLSKKKPMASSVLVVGLFRPPALFAPTLGEPPKNVMPPSGATPVPMGPLEMPGYPVNALFDGAVMLELDVASHGGVVGIGVARSSPAFDKSAVGAASSLIFTPARVHGRQAPAYVYVVAAFRQPIT